MLHIPPEASLSDETIDLIQRLCCAADTRLGRAPGGAADLKRHLFFAGIEFESLRQRRAPFIPLLRYPTDTSNFDSVDPDDQLPRRSASLDSLHIAGGPGGVGPAVSSCESGRQGGHAFLEFTFRRFFDDNGQAHVTRFDSGDGDDAAPIYVWRSRSVLYCPCSSVRITMNVVSCLCIGGNYLFLQIKCGAAMRRRRENCRRQWTFEWRQRPPLLCPYISGRTAEWQVILSLTTKQVFGTLSSFVWFTHCCTEVSSNWFMCPCERLSLQIWICFYQLWNYLELPLEFKHRSSFQNSYNDFLSVKCGLFLLLKLFKWTVALLSASGHKVLGRSCIICWMQSDVDVSFKPRSSAILFRSFEELFNETCLTQVPPFENNRKIWINLIWTNQICLLA